MSVPAPVGYDDNRLAAFNRLNEIRLSAGLGLLAQDTRLDQGAQAHADWEISNDLYQHDEISGTPGFTGEHWWERSARFGYDGHGGEEVMSSGYSAAAGVNALVNAIYHREAILDFNRVDVGVGWSNGSSSHVTEPLVLDMSTPSDGSTRADGQTAQSSTGGVIVWPMDGATQVWTHMGGEAPNPVPTADVFQLGTPASITVDYWKKLVVTNFTMTEDAAGVQVPAVILKVGQDANGLVGQQFVGLIPLEGLKQNTVYRVNFEGGIGIAPFTASTPYQRTWIFTTGSIDYPSLN